MCSTNSQLRAHRHITSNLMESNTPETSVCQENKTFISGKHVQPSTFFKYARTPSSSTLFFSCSRQRGEHFFVLNSLQCKESSREWKSKSQIPPPPVKLTSRIAVITLMGGNKLPLAFPALESLPWRRRRLSSEPQKKKVFFFFFLLEPLPLPAERRCP